MAKVKKQEEKDQKPQIQEKGAGKHLAGHIVISKTDDPQAMWYVAHTTSGHEARVSEALRQRVESMGLTDKIFEILIPTQDRVVVKSGRKANIKEKIFPGYMLVKMILEDTSWLAVRTTQGVTGFVGSGSKPTPLSEKEVQNITSFVSSPAPRFKTKFTTGEPVKITDGPFAESLGTIQEVDDLRGRVKVLISAFGREVPVDLDFLQISKV